MLSYGSESWVVSGEMLKVLEEFRHRLERWIAGMAEKCGSGREW